MKRFTSAQDHGRGGGPEAPAALYVNYFELGHNPFEFLFELGQYQPASGASDAEAAGTTVIHTRLAMAPPYAKMLADLLVRSLRDHEAAHGEITLLDDPAPALAPLSEELLAPPGDFEARARALRAAAHPHRPLNNKAGS
jgi:hypothetical protein